MELWDAYNADGTKAGFELIKGQKIPDGIYRTVCSVTVRHTDGTYLLVKSASEGSVGTEIYECSAFGAVLKGENSYGAAVRRLKEKTGITAKGLELINFEIIKSENAIIHGYLCEVDFDKSSEELFGIGTAGFSWASESEIYGILTSDECKIAYKDKILPYFAQRMKISKLKYGI